MRIVYLNPAAELGGAERCLLDMMAAVQKARPSLDLHLLVSMDGSLVDRASQLGIGVTILPMPRAMVQMGDSMLAGPGRRRAIVKASLRGTMASWPTWKYARALSRTLCQLKPDLIHSNGIKFHLLARLAHWRGAPVVWHIHDFLSFRPLMARALRFAAARTSGAIAVSRAVQQDAQSVLPRLPVELVYNGINTADFSPGAVSAISLDDLAGLPQANAGTVRIGLVATFARWKGHEIFLKAASQMLETASHPPARFFIIGGPIYQTSGSQFSCDELRALVAQLGIERHVGFIPFQNNPANVFRALDIAVHASTRAEPFGRTIVEAMACARPVVVAQAGGAAELFHDDHDAVGVVPGDPAALASALVRLVTDPARRERLAANARLTAIERFSHDRLGPQILAAYRRFLHASIAA